MHRGYWARVYAVRKLVETMISSGIYNLKYRLKCSNNFIRKWT
jgi:hypothetical protein